MNDLKAKITWSASDLIHLVKETPIRKNTTTHENNRFGFHVGWSEKEERESRAPKRGFEFNSIRDPYQLQALEKEGKGVNVGRLADDTNFRALDLRAVIEKLWDSRASGRAKSSQEQGVAITAYYRHWQDLKGRIMTRTQKTSRVFTTRFFDASVTTRVKVQAHPLNAVAKWKTHGIGTVAISVYLYGLQQDMAMATTRRFQYITPCLHLCTA